VALGALIVLTGLNIWTGAPLLALWIAARVQGEAQLEMSGLLIVVLVFGAASLLLVRLLAILGVAYEGAAGRPRTVRRHVPWLRSMRGERPSYPGDSVTITMLERILIVMVVVAVLLFEAWFFFLASSPIPSWAPSSA
jgi:hypothetical protein